MKQLLLISLTLFYTTSIVSAQSLSALFAPPSNAEINAVIADWNARDVGVYDWTLEGSGTVSGGLPVDVVSHTVAGYTHYAFVRLPQNYDPSKKYPILIANHGGTGGTSIGIVAQHGLECYRDYFVLGASFQGEPLDATPLGLGILTSGGPISEFDRDVDDVIALLNGTIANYAGADETNVSVFGGSRGGCVSYLLSVRDARIHTGVYFYGATDHMTYPGLEAIIQNILDTGGGANPFYNTVRNFAEPYMDGTMSLADARMELLSRSAIHFIQHNLPDNMQIHHGDADGAVPVENSRIMDTALTNSSLPTGNYTYYEYPGGGHGSNMPMSIDRKNDFIWASSCPDKGLDLQLKVLLQGAYDTGGMMRDDLRSAGELPTSDPYGMSETIPNPMLLTVMGNNAIVDWVLVEFRPKDAPETVRLSFPALVQRDGDVVSLTGNPTITIDNLPYGDYHVSVRHRNHLGVMTSMTVLAQ